MSTVESGSGPSTRDGQRELAGEIDRLQASIAEFDAEIVRLAQARAEAERRLQHLRLHLGGTRTAHRHDLAVFRRFGPLGADGRIIATALLRLARRGTP